MCCYNYKTVNNQLNVSQRPANYGLKLLEEKGLIKLSNATLTAFPQTSCFSEQKKRPIL